MYSRLQDHKFHGPNDLTTLITVVVDNEGRVINPMKFKMEGKYLEGVLAFFIYSYLIIEEITADKRKTAERLIVEYSILAEDSVVNT